jgi:hypothetical protein
LLEAFITENQQHTIIVYRKKNLAHNRYNFFDGIRTKKIFEAEKFSLMIFFDSHIPFGYK